MLVSVDTKECRVDTKAPTFGSCDVRISSLDAILCLGGTDGKYNDTPLGVGAIKQNKRRTPLKGCKEKCVDTRNGRVSVDTLIRKRLWSL